MSKPLMIIINPAAGKGKYKDGLPDALKLLSDAGYCPIVFFTERRGHATELAATHGEGFEKLICLGGDGTLAEVIAGLMRIKKRPQIGYIPIGTANDVARTLGLPKDNIIEGVRRFLGGTPKALDTGVRDGGYFNYVAAFGAFTEVSYDTPQDKKRALGELAYLIGAAKALGKLKSRHVKIEYDDGELEGDYLYGSMSNSYSVAGLIDLPRDVIDLGDGLHELVVVKKLPNAGQFVKLAAKVLTHDLNSEYIVILHTKKAVFHFDEPTAWSFDGENGGEHEVITFENSQKAIEIIC